MDEPLLRQTLHEPPAAVVYLTDLEGPAPEEPAFPVLWCVPEGGTREAPFGERDTLSPWEG